VSWFRSSRRRLSEQAPQYERPPAKPDQTPVTERAEAAPEPAPAPEPQPEIREEPAPRAEPNGALEAPARDDWRGRPLADLHALARERGVPRYRLLRRRELISALSGVGPADVAVSAPERAARSAPRSRPKPQTPSAPPLEVEVSEVGAGSVEVLAAVQRLVGQLSSSAAAPSASDLEEIMGSPAVRLIVARTGDGEVVGMLTLATFRIPTGMRAWIEDVVVDEGARGHGVGESLTREALRLASEAGARTVDLTSRRERQAANRMYRKLGFERRQTTVYRIEPGS
jgi:ribosomal protein S18 acetylase RimI-like enzyme